nr:MAG: replication initiation protein [Microvirus sp.]
MTCYHPLDAWLRISGKTSKTILAFHPAHGGRKTGLPCGKCIGCRLDHSAQWATRLCNEAQMHEASSFITLTFNDENLPHDYSLDGRTLQLFFKALRNKIYPQKVRFYAAGEYGEKLHRPHYHALIYGYSFPDRRFHQEVRGNIYYTSAELENIWQKGFCVVGDITAESAAYTARYVTKKINGDPWHNHYTRMHPHTGELHPIKEEFAHMSRKPGIGNSFYKKYFADIFPDDFIVINGKKRKVPNYYMALLSKDNPKLYELIKNKRYLAMLENQENNTPERLATRETCQIRRADKLLRSLE